MAKRYWINYLKDYVFTPAAPANDSTSETGPFKAMLERVLNRLTDLKGVPWYQATPTTLSNASSHIAEDAATAHGGSIQATQKDGTAQTFRATYNFTGPGVTVSDDSVNNRSNIDIPGGTGGGGGSAHIIQEEGSTLTARSRLNFRGVASTATDDSANDRTNVDIRGNVHRSGTAPTSPVSGELWLDTSTSPATLREYNGSVWNGTSGTPGDGTVTDVKVASAAGIAKSKLAPLNIDRSDMAANHSVLVTSTSTTHPSSPVTGQAVYETDTQGVYINTGTPSVPVWTSITASAAYQDPAYISGLTLTYDGANTLGIETGAAYVEGSSSVLAVPTRLTRSVTFAASQTAFSYVYLFDNGGTADIEITTTAPAAPYRGFARSKTGATSRRYLGAVLPNGVATPSMYKWRWIYGDVVRYLENVNNTPFLVVNDGQATTETTVNCAGVVPPTSNEAVMYQEHGLTTSGASLVFGSADDNLTLSASAYVDKMARGVGGFLSRQARMTLTSSQTFTYLFTSSPGSTLGFNGRVLGYQEQR